MKAKVISFNSSRIADGDIKIEVVDSYARYPIRKPPSACYRIWGGAVFSDGKEILQLTMFTTEEHPLNLRFNADIGIDGYKLTPIENSINVPLLTMAAIVANSFLIKAKRVRLRPGRNRAEVKNLAHVFETIVSELQTSGGHTFNKDTTEWSIRPKDLKQLITTQFFAALGELSEMYPFRFYEKLAHPFDEVLQAHGLNAEKDKLTMRDHLTLETLELPNLIQLTQVAAADGSKILVTTSKKHHNATGYSNTGDIYILHIGGPENVYAQSVDTFLWHYSSTCHNGESMIEFARKVENLELMMMGRRAPTIKLIDGRRGAGLFIPYSNKQTVSAQ